MKAIVLMVMVLLMTTAVSAQKRSERKAAFNSKIGRAHV